MGITSGLASFSVGTTFKDLPDDVVSTSKDMLLNILGVTLAGSVHKTSDIINQYAGELGNAADCTLIGRAARSSATGAALVNGTMAHVLDYDENVQRRGNHPSNSIMPAVLAAGELRKASGAELLEAFVIGCEVSTKIGAAGDFDALKPTMWRYGWHLEGVACTIGATAAVGKLLGLDQEAMENAFGIATSEASGVQVNYGTSTKSLHSGRAAMNGVMAASLAEKGFTGARNALEDENGLLGCYRRDNNVDADDFIAHVGRPYDVVDPGVGLKAYPCASATHSALGAVDHIVGEHGIRHTDVERVRISVPPRLGNTRRMITHPVSGLEGKFSIHYCVAVTLVHGTPRMEHFTDEAVLGDERVRAMLDRITVTADEEATKEVPRPSTAVVTMADGSRLTYRNEFPKGHPRNPMTAAELEAKFLDCSKGLLSEAAARAVIDKVRGLETADSVLDLAACLAASPSSSAS
jgi:2-methylcitrate dehydratase PrpD